MDGLFILHLIRHAPTAGNKGKQYIGWTDEPALPFEAAKDTLLRKVWGSDLMRCRQTAAILFPNAVYHANPDWRECHFGNWEQKTYAQLQHDQRYRDWIDDPEIAAPPGGESLGQLSIRVDRAIRSLPEGNEFTVITHGGPIRCLTAKAIGGKFQQQTALHGHRHSIAWESRRAYEEGAAMQIVFGGAFNGKRQYVKGLIENCEASWHEGELPSTSVPLMVVAGVEHWVKGQLEKEVDEKTIVQLVESTVSRQAPNQQIWILTDINRGIVPIDPLERELRDVIGRLYQHLFKKADRVTRIWYGIPQTIKGAD